MSLSDEVNRAASNLRSYGVKDGGLPRGGGRLYDEARYAWLNDKSPQAERNWRIMALTYGAVLAFRGDWTEASLTYSDNPEWVGNVPEANPECRHLAALMAMGDAVSRWHAKLNPFYETYQASRYFGMVDMPSLNRWRAVNAAVQAMSTEGNTSLRAREAALHYLNGEHQSELAVLIQHLNGEGNGKMPRRLGLGSRPATIQPSELYLFNDR